MNTERFHHHAFLDVVVKEDVRYVSEKDRSYGASWKMSGGRSAWFMLRRKMDRMITMMARPEEPHGFSVANCESAIPDKDGDFTVDCSIGRHLVNSYNAEDIFAKIEERPDGEDGSLLAEVRDLRRYLMLVEAEMMARGVVDRPIAAPRDGQEHPFGYPGEE